jgi:predicted CoA-substrate-specific enzyme activase
MITAGVDIGSVATKALILNDQKISAAVVRPTGSQSKAAAQSALDQALAAAGMDRKSVRHIVSTGYGRRVVEFGEKTITEISACAQGMKFLGCERGPVRTLIDLGGQDIKVIAVDANGITSDFAMNDKCAAGTGRFLEVIARALEVKLEELGDFGLKSTKTIAINATCTVFAESEVISLLAQSVKQEDIIAGIHNSIAERIFAMVKKVGLKEIVAFNGGGAKNKGLCHALEQKLNSRLHIPEIPQFVNALGSAVVGKTLG